MDVWFVAMLLGPPFEAAGAMVWGTGQGRLVASAVGLEKAAILVMVRIMVVRMHHLMARGRGAMHRISSLKTSPMCSCGVTIGRLQCVG